MTFDEIRPVAIVLGSDHVASAIAHRLHGDGFGVVMIDDIDPPWTRRGMAYTDAWYAGTTELDGVRAVFCASIRSVPSVLYGSDAIAATSWSWGGVADALAPVVSVDTRAVSRRVRGDPHGTQPLPTLEVVPGAVIGPECHRSIEFLPDGSSGHVRIVHAPAPGRFATLRAIGETIRAGDALGNVNGAPVVAPAAGVLRGLSARGARIGAGDTLAEIDTAANPGSCYGIDPMAAATAAAVATCMQDVHVVRPASPNARRTSRRSNRR